VCATVGGRHRRRRGNRRHYCQRVGAAQRLIHHRDRPQGSGGTRSRSHSSPHFPLLWESFQFLASCSAGSWTEELTKGCLPCEHRARVHTSTSPVPVPWARPAGRNAGTTSAPVCPPGRSRCSLVGRCRCGQTPIAVSGSPLCTSYLADTVRTDHPAQTLQTLSSAVATKAPHLSATSSSIRRTTRYPESRGRRVVYYSVAMCQSVLY
jgi:hypothetical protein